MKTLNQSQRNLSRRTRGVALVEFALILPIVLILLGGLFDVGRGFSRAGVILNAAREGARYGIANSKAISRDEQIKTRVIEEASQSNIQIDPDKVSILTPSGAVSGQPLTVSVAYQYQPLMSGVLGVRTTINKQSTMIIF